MEKFIKDLIFPQKGDYFFAVCVPRYREHIADVNGVAVLLKTKQEDHSFRQSAFKCTAADAIRVVGKFVVNDYTNKPYIFMRSEWRFDQINDDMLQELGIIKE